MWRCLDTDINGTGTCPPGAHCLMRENGMQINSCDPVGQGGQIEEVLNPIWWEMKGIQDGESRNRKFQSNSYLLWVWRKSERLASRKRGDLRQGRSSRMREPKAQSLKVQREQGMGKSFGNRVLWKSEEWWGWGRPGCQDNNCQCPGCGRIQGQPPTATRCFRPKRTI